jgi:hypothetical protein
MYWCVDIIKALCCLKLSLYYSLCGCYKDGLLALFELAVLIVRIKEHSHNVGRSEICLLVVLVELHPSNIEACHKVAYTRLTPPSLKAMQKIVYRSERIIESAGVSSYALYAYRYIVDRLK